MSSFVPKGNQNIEICSRETSQPECEIKKFRSNETIKDYEEFIATVKLSWSPVSHSGERDEFLVDL